MYCAFWKLDKFVCFIDVIITNIKNNQYPTSFYSRFCLSSFFFVSHWWYFFVSLIMPSMEENNKVMNLQLRLKNKQSVYFLLSAPDIYWQNPFFQREPESSSLRGWWSRGWRGPRTSSWSSCAIRACSRGCPYSPCCRWPTCSAGRWSLLSSRFFGVEVHSPFKLSTLLSIIHQMRNEISLHP